MSKTLSVEAVKALVPKTQRNMITEEFVSMIESGAEDNPILLEAFKDNFITYLKVLETGKYKLTDYLNAVKFVSLKLLEYSDYNAWVAVFPERYTRLVQAGKSYDEIAPYVSMYKNKNKLVQQIFEQTIIPSHVLNNPLYQRTIEQLGTVLADENFFKKSPTAWVKAAEALLNHTKAPEVAKVELDIGATQLDAISDLRQVTENLANMQKNMLETGGMSLKEIADSNIIEINCEDENNEK